MKKLSLIAITLISASSLLAQERFSETFNEYEITSPATEIGLPTTGETRKWWSRNDDGTRITKVTYDSNNYFGAGTGNKILYMNRTSGAGATQDQNALTVPFEGLQAGMVSFDFYVGAGAITGETGFLVNLMSNVTAGDFTNYNQTHSAQGVFIAQGAVHRKAAGGANMQAEPTFSYGAGQSNNLKIVFNNSLTAFDYAGGNVASGYMDIYLNGSKAATWQMGQGANAGLGTDINGLWLMLPRTAVGEIYLDNILVTPQAIPEASTVSFITAMVAAGVVVGLRRRMNRK